MRGDATSMKAHAVSDCGAGGGSVQDTGMSPVAYLGPVGTFSHLVARKRFGSDDRLIACPSMGAIFDCLLADRSALAVVPIENSSGGTIYDTVDLLIENA